MNEWDESEIFKTGKNFLNNSQNLTSKQISNIQFDFSPTQNNSIVVYTIYGAKGDGKTTTALGFSGKIYVLCFDRKTNIIKNFIYKGDSRIQVFDAIRYLNEDIEKYPESSFITIKYCEELLKMFKNDKPDYIVFDGTEILMRIFEQAMRYYFNWTAFEGIKNMNAWKKRRLDIRKLHRLAENAAKKGIIYTTYTTQHKIVEDGTVITQKDVPQYYDILLWETDVVIKSFSEFTKQGIKRFFIRIDSSKVPFLKTGATYDITNITIEEIIKNPEKYIIK